MLEKCKDQWNDRRKSWILCAAVSSLAVTWQWPFPVSVLHWGWAGGFVWGSVTARDSPWPLVWSSRGKSQRWLQSLCLRSQPSWRMSCDIHCQHRNRLQMNPPLWLPSLAVVKPPSRSVLQGQCASSDSRMRVWVGRTELGQLSSVNKLTCLDF